MSTDSLERRSFQFDDAFRTTIALEPRFWYFVDQISAIRHMQVESVVADALANRGKLNRASAIRIYVSNFLYKCALDNGIEKFQNRRSRPSMSGMQFAERQGESPAPPTTAPTFSVWPYVLGPVNSDKS